MMTIPVKDKMIKTSQVKKRASSPCPLAKTLKPLPVKAKRALIEDEAE